MNKSLITDPIDEMIENIVKDIPILKRETSKQRFLDLKFLILNYLSNNLLEQDYYDKKIIRIEEELLNLRR